MRAHGRYRTFPSLTRPHRIARAISLLACLTGLATSLHGQSSWMGLLVPAYFPPTRAEEWVRLADAAAQVPLIAIANVFNGPGSNARDDYREAITRVRSAGGRVIGYVHSTYTERPLFEVMSDIDRWAEFYPLDGIFIDEMTNDNRLASVEYYRALHQRVKEKGPTWLVIGNPGTRTLEGYLTRNTADVLVTFENRQGYDTLTPDSWTQRHPASAFAHLCYDVPFAATMDAYVRLARERNAGWIYVTDDGVPNPWDRLPQYWEQEVALLRELNRDQPIRLAVARADAGAIRLEAESIPGRFVVESSSDLAQWREWHATPSREGRMVIVIPALPGEVRFLRVRR